MNKINFFVYCLVFIGLAILANWFWFPEYLLLGLCAITSVLIIIGFFIGVRKMLKDSDVKATEKTE